MSEIEVVEVQVVEAPTNWPLIVGTGVVVFVLFMGAVAMLRILRRPR